LTFNQKVHYILSERPQSSTKKERLNHVHSNLDE